MKIFRLLTVLFISTLCFTACEDEEITNYAFDEISAPTDVSADFDIAQDDSGTVMISPTGEGAQIFEVYFGDDENESPVEVANGETITHTYTEGEYLVRVVAVGSTGLTSEFNQRLVIAFKAPENLMVNIDQSASNPAMIGISASADNATMYDVYFGLGDDEEPTQLMPDETISYTYAAPGTYTIRVVARGAGVATAETTVEVVVPEANDPVKLPITFDEATVNYALGTFNGAVFEIVTNPFLSGENSEASMVGKITNSGALYEGGAYDLGTPVDFSGANKTITVKFYSETAVSVLMKFENGPNGERALEVSADHGGTGWETLSFNFGNDALASFIDGADDNGAAIVPDGQYGTLVLFVEIGEDTAGTFYIDDIMQAEVATDPFKFPVTFDDDNISYTNTGQGFEIVANPQLSGANATNSNVGAVINQGQQYEAVTFTLDEPLDFSSDTKTITMKVYSEVAFPVLFKLETGVNGERANEVEVNHGGTGWEELTFNFNNARRSFVDGDSENGTAFVPTGQYAQFSIFIDFAGTSAGTFYIDDLMQNGDAGTGGGTGTGSTTTSFPVDFESAMNGGASQNWAVFENADNPALEIISNPDMTGNTSSTVAKFTARTGEGAQPYAGTETALQNPFTLNASNSTVKIMVWKSVISDVGIKFANAAGGSTGEIKVANTKTNEWEELTFDFSGVIGDPNNTDITMLVVFPDFQNRTQENVVYFDNITQSAQGSGGNTGGGSSSGGFGLPVDFDADVQYTLGANSVPFEVVTNPQQSGINPTDTKVGAVTNNGGQYEALSFILDEPIDFSGSNKTITVKVYSEVAYQVLLKLETGVNGERANEVEVSHGGTGWEELTFDFNNARNSFVQGDDANNGQAFVPTGQYDEISLFLDFAGFTAGTFYIDDIEQN